MRKKRLIEAVERLLRDTRELVRECEAAQEQLKSTPKEGGSHAAR